MKELIKRLVETYGPPGSEDKIREVIKSEIEGVVDEIKTDVLGNLIAIKKGKGAKVMVAAHMDEIAIMVTHIDDNGFLRFDRIGGVSHFILLGQRAIFADGVVGTFGTEKLESFKDIKMEKLFLDIGAKDKESASRLVEIGDTAVYDRKFEDLGYRLLSKAMDDRIGCAVAIETARRLEGTDNEIYFVFTVQEEVGIRGAITASYGIHPDLGIAVDVTRTGDTPESAIMEVYLGKGPTIKVKDSGIITPLTVRRMMIEVAESNNIPYQLEVLERGATDAAAIQRAREGVLSGVISIPCRYVHTPSEMVDYNDVQNGVNLLVKILEKPVSSQI